MRPLRHSINVTLDGCIDHNAIVPDEEMHLHHTETIAQADALILGRTTYELMEAGWRHPVPEGARPAWMNSFAETINAAKKYVVSSTLEDLDWNAEFLRGDLKTAVLALKEQDGNGLYVGGVQLPRALTDLRLIDEYEFMVHPRLAGYGPYLFDGLKTPVDLTLIDRKELKSGAVVLRYQLAS